MEAMEANENVDTIEAENAVAFDSLQWPLILQYAFIQSTSPRAGGVRVNLIGDDNGRRQGSRGEPHGRPRCDWVPENSYISVVV